MQSSPNDDFIFYQAHGGAILEYSRLRETFGHGVPYFHATWKFEDVRVCSVARSTGFIVSREEEEKVRVRAGLERLFQWEVVVRKSRRTCGETDG